MRQLKREERGFWYSKYLGRVQGTDEEGRLTGEWTIAYSNPKRFVGTVSPRSGNTWGDGFGIGVDCDRTLIIDQIGLGIDETCILWVDSEPELNEDGSLKNDEDGVMTVPNDYTIVMAGESYNYTALAIKKAETNDND